VKNYKSIDQAACIKLAANLKSGEIMVSSKATSVTQYLKEIPDSQKTELKKVRKVIKDNLGKGFNECINWGMITYEVPLSTYPDTYNKKPLMFTALAAQKNNISLYMMCIYQSPEFMDQVKKAYEDIGKKPNIGKSCIRFKKAEDIPLKVIGKIIKKVSLKKFIDFYEQAKNKC